MSPRRPRPSLRSWPARRSASGSDATPAAGAAALWCALLAVAAASLGAADAWWLRVPLVVAVTALAACAGTSLSAARRAGSWSADPDRRRLDDLDPLGDLDDRRAP